MFNKRVRFFVILFSILVLISERGDASEKKEELDQFLDGPTSSTQQLSNLVETGEILRQEGTEYDSDSEDEENYTYDLSPLIHHNNDFKNKSFLPFFRGLHTTRKGFPDKRARQDFKQTTQAGKNVYSSAVYENSSEIGEDLDEKEGSYLALAKKIQDLVKDIECFTGVTIKGKYYANFRGYVQWLYTNDYDEFYTFLLKEKNSLFHKQQEKYSLVIEKNPFVSTSDLADHAYKYAYGLKYLGKDAVKLMPEYDDKGRPKHPYLGKIIFILIPPDALEELNPAFILNLYAEGNIPVSTHYCNNILSEREITFPGYIPGQHVLLDLPVRVPSFHKEWSSWHLEKYGLKKKKFDNFRKKILETQGNIDIQQEPVEALIKSIYPHLAKKNLEKIKAFLENNGSHLKWKGFYNKFLDAPLSIEKFKEEREARISEYKDPYDKGETITVENLTFHEIKILTDIIEGNTLLNISIDEWDAQSLSSFLQHHIIAEILSELTLNNFNIMYEASQLEVIKKFVSSSCNLKKLTLKGKDEAYEGDNDNDYNYNKYGITSNHLIYEEDSNIKYFREFIEKVINKPSIETLDISNNHIPNNAIEEIKKLLRKSPSNIKIIYECYCPDSDVESINEFTNKESIALTREQEIILPVEDY